jgi:RNA recognition motif-containing protein
MSDRSQSRERNGNGREPSRERRDSAERGRSHERDRSRSREDRRNRDPDAFTQVYVAKLHRRTREDDLRDAFSKFGKIKNLVLKQSYSFIDYEDHEAAVAAVKEMNGKAFVNGEELVVE